MQIYDIRGYNAYNVKYLFVVFWAMIRRMQDLPDVSSSEKARNSHSVITVYQFLEYLLEDPPMPVEERIEQVTLECLYYFTDFQK